jgi:hypothetical protein
LSGGRSGVHTLGRISGSWPAFFLNFGLLCGAVSLSARFCSGSVMPVHSD